MDLGSRMRRLRLEKGLTQAELAEPNYTFAYVSTIEAGKRTPSKQALEFFAAKLSVDPQELATGLSPGVISEMRAELLEARSLISGADKTSLSEAETSLERVRKMAKQLDATDIELKARTYQALIAEMRNDSETALALYEEVIAEAATGSPLSKVDAVAGQARILQTRGETAYAVFVVKQLLAELKATGLEDPSALVRLHSSLVAGYFGEGLMKQASESAEIALGLAPRVDNAERVGVMNLHVGILLTKQRRWDEAEAKLREAEAGFEASGLRSEMARAQLVRAINLRDRGQHDEARTLFAEVQGFFAGAGNELSEARTLVASAVNERLAGGAEDARFALKRSLTLAGADKGVIGIAHRELGLCEQDQTKAVTEIRKAIEILQDAGNARELAATYSALGDVLSGAEGRTAAGEAYRTAAEVLMQVA